MPANPLDVLAQQVVAATAVDEWDVDELFDARPARGAVRDAAPRRRTTRRSTCSRALPVRRVRASCGPASSGTGSPARSPARPGAQRLAVTSGGTIPDRGLFGVFLVGEKASRVGELDEEMVYESRVGDVFALGATSWRIEDITHDRVLVSPAPGPARAAAVLEGRPARPARRARRARSARSPASCRALTTEQADRALHRRRARRRGRPTTWSPSSTSSARPPATLPTDRHARWSSGSATSSATGGSWSTRRTAPRCTPRGRWRSGPGCASATASTPRRMPGDDGIVLRVPETDQEPPGADVVVFEPDEIEDIVTAEVGGSALFASRFRECAARALLLPRRDPGRRSPLWQQRQRSRPAARGRRRSTRPSRSSSRRSASACRTSTTCPALRRPDARPRLRARIRVVEVATTQPSPFARSLLFGYVAAFMYEGDSPLAERRAAALSLDQGLLAELLGRAELRELLDPDVLAELERELQRLTPDRQARDAEGVADLLRLLGPLSDRGGRRALASTGADVGGWLVAAGRRAPGRRGADGRRASAGPRSRTSPGCATGSACRCRRARRRPSPSRSTTRWPTWSPATPAPTARSRPPTSPTGSASASRSPTRRCPGSPPRAGCSRASSGPPARAPSGATPRCCAGCGAGRWPRCARRSSRSSRRRSAGSCRPGRTSAGRAARRRRRARRGRAAGRLRGARVARWSRWCSAAGSSTTSPAMLDELTATGEVLWAGHGTLPGTDGWVSLHLADTAPLTLPDHGELDADPAARRRPRGARRRRRVLLPPARPTRVGVDRRQGARGGAVGPGLGGPARPTTRSRRCGR